VSMIERQPVTDASAWKGPDMALSGEWLEVLSADEIADLDAALAHVKRQGIPLLRIAQADFPLPVLGPRLERVLDDVRCGRGFAVLRGIPVSRYSEAENEIIFWGIGTYFGRPISQNANGDLMGHVYDHGVHMHADRVRGYMTPDHLRFHSDRCDLVGLECIRKARAGGTSRLVSMTALHNAILDSKPDLLEPFYRGFLYVVSELNGDTRPVRVPSYSVTDGVLSCRLQRNQIEMSARKCGEPLTEKERAALGLLDRLAESRDFMLEMDLEPGDLQFCNNYVIAHGRTDFEDGDGEGEKRLMLRLWLKFAEARPVGDAFFDFDGIPVAAI
jgi:hypothetical protein